MGFVFQLVGINMVLKWEVWGGHFGTKMVPNRGAGVLKHRVFSCFWSLRVLKPSYFSMFLVPGGALGALWSPRGAQRAIFEHFRVHFGPPFGVILGAFWG